MQLMDQGIVPVLPLLDRDALRRVRRRRVVPREHLSAPTPRALLRARWWHGAARLHPTEESVVTGFKPARARRGARYAPRRRRRRAAALLRHGTLLVTLVLQRRMLTKAVRCDLLEMVSGCGRTRVTCNWRRCSTSSRTSWRCSTRHNLSFGDAARDACATHRAHAAACHQKVIDAAIRLSSPCSLRTIAPTRPTSWATARRRAAAEGTADAHDAAACVGLLAFDADLALVFVDRRD